MERSYLTQRDGCLLNFRLVGVVFDLRNPSILTEGCLLPGPGTERQGGWLMKKQLHLHLSCSVNLGGGPSTTTPLQSFSQFSSKWDPREHLLQFQVIFYKHACMLSCVWRFVTPWTIACQAPLRDSPGKNTEVGCCFLLQGILPTLGSNLCLWHWQVDSLQSEPLGLLISA